MSEQGLSLQHRPTLIRTVSGHQLPFGLRPSELTYIRSAILHQAYRALSEIRDKQ